MEVTTMNEGLSAGDILALTKDNDNDMWNNPFIYLVWLAILGGGGIFGGGRTAELQNAVTRSDLFEGFNNQDVNGQLRGITSGICDGFYATRQGISELGYAMKDCCCGINRNIDAVRYEGAQNTCAITNAIHAEGEATRALINANTMQDLRDKLEARDRDILARDFQLSQLSQNAYLVNELRPCAKPAYITCSPYYVPPATTTTTG
jgi:hypothetical protein